MAVRDGEECVAPDNVNELVWVTPLCRIRVCPRDHECSRHALSLGVVLGALTPPRLEPGECLNPEGWTTETAWSWANNWLYTRRRSSTGTVYTRKPLSQALGRVQQSIAQEEREGPYVPPWAPNLK